MGTRSLIVAQHSRDDLFHCIYCHWDGYPEGVGKVLLEHYQDQAKIDALLDLGDISILAESPFTPPVGHAFNDPARGYVVAYHRDRGEKLEMHPPSTCVETALQECSIGGAEYYYARFDGQWHVRKPARTWQRVSKVLEDEE